MRTSKTVTVVTCDHCGEGIADGAVVMIESARVLAAQGCDFWDNLDLHPSCYNELLAFFCRTVVL